MSRRDVVFVDVHVRSVVLPVGLDLLLYIWLLALISRQGVIEVRAGQLSEGSLLLGCCMGGPGHPPGMADTFLTEVVLFADDEEALGRIECAASSSCDHLLGVTNATHLLLFFSYLLAVF